MQPVSATLITYNEEQNIARALESLSWADEIVVVDSGSSDKTLEICRRFTDKIFHRDWTGYVDQKNFAVEKAFHNWIFSLDADERVSLELRAQIEALASVENRASGYRIPRVAFFMGRWIRHGTWYPDYQVRLFDRRHGRWEGGRVHESVRIQGKPESLTGEIHHFVYGSFTEYLRRLEIYSNLAALDYLDKGKPAMQFNLFAKPFAAFFNSYLLKRGFLDGTPGFAVAVLGSISAFFKHAKLYELKRNPP
jgi:glycosyltransferase involved in cell wall biosynthesis